jgi:hypothetical protein
VNLRDFSRGDVGKGSREKGGERRKRKSKRKTLERKERILV